MTNPPMQLNCSVVIPVFNKEDTIVRAVESVLSQTMLPKEVIVVNDASTDSTAQMLDRFRNVESVTIVDLPNNRGVSSARNYGVGLATADWVAFLDADDYWRTEFLWNCSQAISPGVNLIGTAYSYFSAKGNIAAQFPKACAVLNQVDDYYEWAVNGDLPFTASSVLVRREALAAFGGFSPELSMGEDQVVWLRLLQSGLGVFVNKPLATYDLTNSSAVSGLAHRLSDPVFIDYMLCSGPTNSIYLKPYIARAMRSSLVYQCAYERGAVVRSSLSNQKVSYLNRGEFLCFQLASWVPSFIRFPILRRLIKKLNQKWG